MITYRYEYPGLSEPLEITKRTPMQAARFLQKIIGVKVNPNDLLTLREGAWKPLRGSLTRRRRPYQPWLPLVGGRMHQAGPQASLTKPAKPGAGLTR